MSSNKDKVRGKSDRKARTPRWDLRLYIAGETPKARKAIETLRGLCQEQLGEGCRLEIIDLRKNPALARGDQIVAVPTLVRKLPPPLKRIIGDLTNVERVLVGLDLRDAQRGSKR
jgi:circadian clock protein KaiB